MPEGDTLFRTARTLNLALGGKKVEEFSTALAHLSRVDIDTPIKGRTIDSVVSRGKHLLIAFSGDLVLRSHLRMSGSWHIYRRGERWRRPRHDFRVSIATSDFEAVGFNLPVAEFLDAAALERQPDLRLMGEDLLSDSFDIEKAIVRMKGFSGDLAGALLNQRVVAGIGNVYKSELLFLARLDPWRSAAEVGEDSLRELLGIGVRIMKSNVVDGHGSAMVTYTGFRRTTGRSDPAERLWVYGRGGKPCRKCATPIERAKQGPDVRSTYWCPRCQGRV